MSRLTIARQARATAAGATIAAAALLTASCGEDLHTGPEKFHATLEPRNWADTLVLGDGRPVGVRVIDDQGREVLDAAVHWSVATPAVLGAAALRATTLSPTRSDAAVDAHGGDSVQVDARRPGTTDVLVTLTDPRFYTTTMTRRATVVVAGVRASSARDTTITALGDTALMLGIGLAHSTAAQSRGAVVPRAGVGIVWNRLGSGAVQLAGASPDVGAGDSVRAVGQQGGTDTLVATHPFCLQGAQCADTILVRVAQRGALGVVGSNAPAFRVWSFGDSVVPTVRLQDARGHAVAGASLQVAPVAAADSAIVSVGAPPASTQAAAAQPSAVRAALARATVAAPLATRAATSATARRVPAHAPLLMTVRRVAALGPSRDVSRDVSTSTALSQVAPVALTPLVAQANGTARVALRAVAADGTLLAADTITVIVRQIAAIVHVTPPQSQLTPGDSIPVRMEARDARGYVIADAAFSPAAAGAAISQSGVVRVAPGTAAGLASVLATVTGPASPAGYADAPIQTPAQDTAWVRVRVPPATVSGDTTGTALDAPVFSADGKPVVGAWVRFVVPAGHVSPDSVQTGTDGVAHASWTMPTRAGTYTATAIMLGTTISASDSAGRIVLRRTLGVEPGAAAGLTIVSAPPAATAAGVVLASAPAVQVVDGAGNAVRGVGVPITVSLGANAVGTLAGTLTVSTDSAGVARFGDLVLNGPAGARTLRFGGPSLAALGSTPITVTAGAISAGQTAVVLSAPSVASGATVSATVTPRDAAGNPLGAGHAVVIVVAGAGSASTATASPATDVGDGTYVVTLTGVRAGSPAPVTATVDGLAATTTPALQVTPGAATHLTVAPSTIAFAAFGAANTAAVTSATDNAGNAVPTAGLVWTSSAPAVATVAGGTPPTSATITSVATGGTTVTAHLGAATASVAVAVQQTAAQLIKLTGDNEAASAGTAVATPPAVRVQDAQGAPVAGAVVLFSVANGGTTAAGNIAGAATQTVTTGANGIATAGSWTLGTAVGNYALAATVANVPVVQFAATATVGAAAQVAVTAGNAQTATVLTRVSIAPAVTVTDALGNPVPGIGVTFAAATGQGTLTGATVSTNASGVATLGSWTLGGTAGVMHVTATAAGVSNAATVTATAIPGAPSQVVMQRDSLLLAALSAGDTVTAVVRDAGGNVLPAATVTWAVTAPGTITLGANGTRADGTKWTQVTAAANGLVRVVATAGALQGATKTAVHQVATQITATGPSTPMDIGDTTSVAVTATDANGNTVPRTFLTFATSGASVVSIDSVGRLRGIGPGTASLTVSSGVAGGASATTAATTVTTSIAYHDFCTLAGLNISGSTTRSGCVLRLTGASSSETGGVWQPVPQKLSASFETSFTFQISAPGGMAPGGADGLALVIQSTSNTATGQLGGGIGYPGLTNALAIELDTWQNSENNDPSANHVAVQSCGTAAITAVHNTNTAGAGCTWGSPVTPSVNFKDGQVHTVRVSYVPGALSVYFDGSATPAITSAITLTNVKGNSILDAQGRAWIGFTGATGGAWENHDVLAWSLTPSP